MSEFFSHRTIKATRKLHRCCACNGEILVGSSTFYFSQKQDGFFYDGHYHLDCREAEIALNDNNQTSWDEWMSLSALEEPDDFAWLREAFPAVADRLPGHPAKEA